MNTLALFAFLPAIALCPRLAAQTPAPSVPVKNWRVQATLCVSAQPDTYAVRLEPYPDNTFTCSPDKRAFQMTATDSLGHHMPTAVTLLPEPPAVPDYGPLTRKNDPPGLRWIGVRWKPRGLPPGLYTLSVSVPVTAKDKAGTVLTLPAATDSLSIYQPPMPDKLPSQTPGQRFLCLPDWTVGVPYLDKHGQTVRQALLASKLFTLKRIDRAGRWPVVYFAVEGLPGLVHIGNGGPLPALPGLCPLVEDAEVRSLRRRYEGKQVWGYGGIGGQCALVDSRQSIEVGADNQAPCRLVHLVRICRTATQLSIGTKPGVVGGAAQSTFTTNYPLIAILASVPDMHLSVLVGDGKPIYQQSKCRTLYAEFAGAWDFERTYSLVSPSQAGRHWPCALRKAVLAGEMRVGMTPDMVAWTLGYPSAYGTAAQIKAQPLWEYDTLPPFHYSVTFDKGKVSSFGPDGELP